MSHGKGANRGIGRALVEELLARDAAKVYAAARCGSRRAVGAFFIDSTNALILTAYIDFLR